MAQFVLFAFFILSEFEGSVKRKLKKWRAESFYRRGKGTCYCDRSPLHIDFDYQDHVNIPLITYSWNDMTHPVC